MAATRKTGGGSGKAAEKRGAARPSPAGGPGRKAGAAKSPPEPARKARAEKPAAKPAAKTVPVAGKAGPGGPARGRAAPRTPSPGAAPQGASLKPVPNLSEEEAGERVRILRRFRELLQAQRARFQEYLDILEKQKDLIEGEWAAASGSELEAQITLESQIVADIFSIQKVIDPLESLYRTVYPLRKRRGRPKKEEEGIPDLKSTLEELCGEAAAMVDRNRKLLSRRMEDIRSEIKTLSANPYRKGRSVYGETPAPSLIDIEG